MHLLNFKHFGFIICLLFFSACTEQSNSTSNLKVFKYNQASGITSLDPAFAKDQATIWATTQLFDGLVQVDKDLNVLPAIAEKWEISEDGKTYTFFLRKDVMFHPHELLNETQRKVTAKDFVYSFNRIIDDKVASPGKWIFSERVDLKEPFKAIDEYTFQLKLRSAFRPMLGILSMPYCYVVPEEVVEHYGKDFRINPIGTGPFKFKQWRENEVLVYTKNENYHENGLPYLDGVRISFYENKKSEYLKLLEGELDFMSGIDPTFKDEVLSENGNLKSNLSDRIYLQKSPYLNTEYLGFKTTDPNCKALEDKRVRQAINHCFDRKKMMAFLRNNIGAPALQGFIPRGLPSHNNAVKGYDFNPSKAEQLLKEAGYPKGKGISEFKLITNASYQDLSTFIVKQMNEIGLPVKMEINQPSFLRQLMVKGEVDFFRGSWIADYPDGESFLTVFYGNNPAPPNYTRFKNKKFDDLYQQALLANDDKARYEIYNQMDRILIDEAPVVPLYYDEVMRFLSNDVSGLENNAQNLLILKYAKKK